MTELEEVEVKFYLHEINTIRERIEDMGGISKGRTFEHNLRFEDSADSLKSRQMLLRLRKDRQVRLTVKVPSEQRDRDFKIYRELEVVVDDFNVCRRILEALGFQVRQIYEKWRETFVLGRTALLIDETPFGVFLEIEGEKGAIRRISKDLGLPWNKKILLNYLQIFEILRDGEKLDFKDMAFDKFRSISVDVEKYMDLLCTG